MLTYIDKNGIKVETVVATLKPFVMGANFQHNDVKLPTVTVHNIESTLHGLIARGVEPETIVAQLEDANSTTLSAPMATALRAASRVTHSVSI